MMGILFAAYTIMQLLAGGVASEINYYSSGHVGDHNLAGSVHFCPYRELA